MTDEEILAEFNFIKAQLSEIRELIKNKQDSVPFEKALNYLNSKITVLENTVTGLETDVDLLKES